MPSCNAFNCCYRYKCTENRISVHRFPFSRPEILNKWIANIRRENWYPTKTSVLCSNHFEESCFIKSGLIKLLRKDAVPTLFNFPPHLNKVCKKRKAPEKCAIEPSTSEDSTQPIQSLPDHSYYNSPQKFKKILEEKNEQTKLYKKKLKVKQQQIRRLSNKIHSLSELLDHLNSKKLVSDNFYIL